MPVPKPNAGESRSDYVSRFMANPTMRSEYPDEKQRAAIAYDTWRRKRRKQLEKIIAEAQVALEQAASEYRELAELTWVEKREPPADVDGEGGKVEFYCEFLKAEEESDHTFVWGPVLLPDVVDKQGDVIDAEEIEQTAHSFLEDSGRPGLLHRMMLGSRDATIVESGILRSPMKLSKTEKLPAGTWVLGMNVYNEKVRKSIKEGTLKGFSIGGNGLGVEQD